MLSVPYSPASPRYNVEKQGVIKPGVTPEEKKLAAKTAAETTPRQTVLALDDDFRKRAAASAQK